MLRAAEALRRVAELVEVLGDAVATGASVNFLAGVSEDDLRAFWERAITDPQQVLLAALVEDRVVGTVLLVLAPQQNSPHRAEVAKMLVHSAWRRHGIGARLLAAVEAEALARGRTLLLLDTEQGSAGEAFYVAASWVRYGEVPGHALLVDGTPAVTSFFYKDLAGWQDPGHAL